MCKWFCKLFHRGLSAARLLRKNVDAGIVTRQKLLGAFAEVEWWRLVTRTRVTRSPLLVHLTSMDPA